MFREEARWINTAFARAGINPSKIVLDVGASNLMYRTVIQPHVDELIHKPLIDKGVKIKFLDIRNDEGVDIVLDLATPELPDEIFNNSYDLIICCNILEHIRRRDFFMRNLLRFSRPGTLLMVTVPLIYPKHNDPIDTMFRPGVKELIDFIGTYAKVKTIESNELEITEKDYYIYKPGRILDHLSLKSQRWLLRWYIKPLRWKVTCVLLEVQ